MRWRSAWRIWTVLVGVSFLALELPALLNDYRGDTLSERVWSLDGWRFVVVGLTVWLSIHFARQR